MQPLRDCRPPQANGIKEGAEPAYGAVCTQRSPKEEADTGGRRYPARSRVTRHRLGPDIGADDEQPSAKRRRTSGSVQVGVCAIAVIVLLLPPLAPLLLGGAGFIFCLMLSSEALTENEASTTLEA